MDYTKVPKELIYTDKLHLEDFGTDNRTTLNGQLSIVVRRYLFVEMGRNDYRAILLYLLNEAHYLTTMLLMDDNADDVFDVYVKSVLKDSPYPEDISNIFRRLTLAICYIYLERPSIDSLTVRTIRRHLRNHAFEFIYLNSELSGYKHPEAKEFKPVTLTEKLVNMVNWKTLTNNFRPEAIKDYLDYLGETKKEKRLLIMSIYKQLIHHGELYSVPYSVDSLLATRYRQAGGRIWDMVSENQNRLSKISNDLDEIGNYFEKINIDAPQLLFDQMRQKSRIEMLEKENRELKQQNRLLTEELNNKTAYYEKQKTISHNHEEMKQREEALKGQIRDMKKIIDNLQGKLGNKAIQLKYIVESIKNKAEFAGLKEAYLLFEQIDLMLYEEPVWRENRSELVNFFKERNKERNVGIVMLDNHGTVNSK